MPMVARVPSNLFEQPSLIQAARLDRTPTDFAHKFSQTAAGAGPAISLSDLKDVKNRLGGDSLHAIATDFTLQPLQRQTPRVGNR